MKYSAYTLALATLAVFNAASVTAAATKTKIVETTEDNNTPSSPTPNPKSSSILSMIPPLAFVEALDAIRRHRVESWARSSHRRLKECWDAFTWSSKGGKGKGGKSDEKEQGARSDEKEQEGARSYLFVQMADQCTFELGSDGTVRFYSNRFLDDTEIFADMPFTEESVVSTEEFFSGFHTTYFRGYEHPNAAFTLIDDNKSEGVVVSALASAFVGYPSNEGEQDTPVFGYSLAQSESQASVRSLSEILDGGSEKTYPHCSVFIDSVGFIGDFLGSNPNTLTPVQLYINFPKDAQLEYLNSNSYDVPKARCEFDGNKLIYDAPYGMETRSVMWCRFKVTFPDGNDCSCEVKTKYDLDASLVWLALVYADYNYFIDHDGCECMRIKRCEGQSCPGDGNTGEWPCATSEKGHGCFYPPQLTLTVESS